MPSLARVLASPKAPTAANDNSYLRLVSDKRASDTLPPSAKTRTYEPFGPWSGFTNGNGITETPTWDLDYRLTVLVDTGTAAVQHIGYTYTTGDQPNTYSDTITPSNSLTTIGYDGFFHVNSYRVASTPYSLTFDNNGNRKTITGTTSGYTAGTDQLASMVTGATTTTVSTNANGNITGFSPGFGTAAVTTLAYNNANRLTSVSSSGGTLGAYVYDAFGQRFSKTVGASTTLYQYSGGALLDETTGGTETNYLYLNGRPLAMLTGTTFTWLHDDNLGRPQVATNAAQAVVWKASYQPYGETIATSGSFTQNLRFAGQYFDAESGFSHNGFRDYVPSLGRYLEADPIGIYDNNGDVNAGMNPYNYVGADPMRTIDPSGLNFWNGSSCYDYKGGPLNNKNYAQCVGGDSGNRDTRSIAENPAFSDAAFQGYSPPTLPCATPVSIWICQRAFYGPNSGVPMLCPICHSFVSLDNPATTLPWMIRAFGKQPRPNGQPGSEFWGRGYVDKELYTDVPGDFNHCTETKVCPNEAARLTTVGPTIESYLMFNPATNCHGWANGDSQ
jgi:RHS repeat-associated protein